MRCYINNVFVLLFWCGVVDDASGELTASGFFFLGVDGHVDVFVCYWCDVLSGFELFDLVVGVVEYLRFIERRQHPRPSSRQHCPPTVGSRVETPVWRTMMDDATGFDDDT